MAKLKNQNARMHGNTSAPSVDEIERHFQNTKKDIRYKQSKYDLAISLSKDEAPLDQARDHLMKVISSKDDVVLNEIADRLVELIEHKDTTRREKFKQLATSIRTRNLINAIC